MTFVMLLKTFTVIQLLYYIQIYELWYNSFIQISQHLTARYSSSSKKLMKRNWNRMLLFIMSSCPFKSSHQRCSIKKGVSENFAKSTGKHLCQVLFFNKVSGVRPATLLKKRLWHGCFPVNFAKFSRTPFLQNTSGWLHLSFIVSFVEMPN